MRGGLTSGPAVVAWDGVVVGADEQYLVNAMGSLLDERRIGGVTWARPTDQSRPWISVPSTEAFDLSVLLDGTVVSEMRSDDRLLIEVHFSGRDALRALTHIPSVGPTEVTVTVTLGVITAVDLHLQDGAAAHLELSDYGEALVIDPINPLAPSVPPVRQKAWCRDNVLLARSLRATLTHHLIHRSPCAPCGSSTIASRREGVGPR